MIKCKNKLLATLICMFLACVMLFGLTLVKSNTVKASVNGSNFYVSGAQIRIDDTVAGIRFNVEVNDSYYNGIITTYGEDADVQFGAYIAPRDKVTNIEDLDADFENVLTIISAGNQLSEQLVFSEGYATYMAAVMYNVPQMLEQIKNSELNPNGVGADMDPDTQNEFLRRAFKMDLIARPFYSVNGEVKDYGDATNATRSMRAIMDVSVIDGYVEEDDPIVKQYLGDATTVSETAYYDVTSGALNGYTPNENVAYAWRGRPVTIKDGKLVGVDDAVSGDDYYLSVFDASSNVTRIPVKCVTVIDSAEEFGQIFSSAEELNGYYMLAQNIDAKDLNLANGIRQNSLFTGTFDGCGYTITNLNVSGTSDNKNGSLFGQIQYPAVIENVAFENVTADYAAVISNKYMVYDTETGKVIPLRPRIENVYVQVKANSTNFRGIIATPNSPNQTSTLYPEIENVIVKALGCDTNENKLTDRGSFFGDPRYGAHKDADTSVLKNNYVISDLALICYYGYNVTDSGVGYDTIAGITRYATVEAMKSATNDYTSFSEDYWNKDSGIPTWKNSTIVDVTDNTERVFDLSDKELDISGLDIEATDITSIEINGVNFAVTNGVLPQLTLTASNSGATKKVTLKGDGLSYATTFEDAVPAITVKVISTKGEKTLTNVKAYSQVIDDETEFETLFKTQANLTGVYALGDNINAEALQLSGALRKNCIFQGIFDGCGYTIRNLNISGTSADINGSLFGQIKYPAVIANVGFENVSADYAAVISSKHLREYEDWTANPLVPLRPVIKNVYIQVKDGSKNFRGIVAAIDTQDAYYPVIENVIVKALGCVRTVQTDVGSFFGSSWFGRKEANHTSDVDILKNNYVISDLALIYHYGYNVTDSGVGYGTIAGITRYATVDEMKGVTTNDYTSFSDKYWKIVDGIPAWKNI